MIKSAISFSGQPHAWKECMDTFVNLYDTNLSKCFGHFWWDKSYLNKCYKMHYSMKMEDENVIKKLIDGFNISECKIEPHAELDFTYVEKFNFDTWKGTTVQYNKMMAPILLYCAYSQIKSINNSIKLIDKERYDIIIRTRPDVMYLKDIKSIINNLKFSSNTIFIQNSNEGGHLYAGEFSNCPCDWFYMGDSNTMILFTQLLKNSFKDKYKYGVIHGRDFVRSVARDNGINLQLIDFGAVLYKQTPLFDKQFITPIDFYNNDFDAETCSIKTHEKWPYWIKYVNFKHFKNLK